MVAEQPEHIRNAIMLLNCSDRHLEKEQRADGTSR